MVVIGVIGFYDRNNLGDETYKVALPMLLGDRYKYVFICSDDITTQETRDKLSRVDVIFVGPGDVINNYFFVDLIPVLRCFKVPKIAFGVGIPFPHLIDNEHFSIFDHVFTRNFEDLRFLQRIIGFNRTHYIPDPALVLSGYHRNRTRPHGKCGIFLAQSIDKMSPELRNNLKKAISYLADRFEIIFYRFNTSENELENDDIINRRIASELISSNPCVSITIDTKRYTPMAMMSVMSQLSFALTVRFHAHIFCMMAKVPFLSVAISRKVKSLAKTANINTFQYVKGNIINKLKLCLTQREIILKHCDAYVAKSRSLFLIHKIHYLIKSSQWYPKPLTNITIPTVDQILSEVKAIELDGSCDIKDPSEAVSSMVCLRLTGNASSDYKWGLKDQYQRQPHLIEDLVKWIHSDVQRRPFSDGSLPIYFDPQRYARYKQLHRSGWYPVVQYLAPYINTNGVYCDFYLESTFLWEAKAQRSAGLIPYDSPWIGFLHHTDNTEHSPNNLIALFESKDFIRSLNTCRGLFTVSKHLTVIVKRLLCRVGYGKVQVDWLYHPTDLKVPSFDFNEWKKKRSLVQIGAWLRHPFLIHTIKTAWYKMALKGIEMNNYFPPPDMKIVEGIPDIVDNPDQTNDSTSDWRGSYDWRGSSWRGSYDIELDYDINPENWRGVIDLKYDINWNDPRGKPHEIKGDLIVGVGGWRSQDWRSGRPSFGGNWWLYYLTQYLIEHKFITSATYDTKTNTYYISTCDFEAALDEIKRLMSDVTVINHLCNDEFDKLKINHVIFLPFIDVAASNSIIESIASNTPMILPKLPAIVDYLGSKYPMYYTTPEQIPKLLTDSVVIETHNYLKSLDKEILTFEHFLGAFRGSRIIENIDSSRLSPFII